MKYRIKNGKLKKIGGTFNIDNEPEEVIKQPPQIIQTKKPTDKEIIEEIKKVRIENNKLEGTKAKEERLKKFVNFKIV
jgi:hypothetical protein